MKIPVLFTTTLCLTLRLSLCEDSLAKVFPKQTRASTPPRGWNSYDSFSWTINEKEFLDSAEMVSQRLLPFGYEYVVVDYLWYRKLGDVGAGVDSLGFDVIDEWGRLMPDPNRWPSSANGNGFTQVANKVHALGLKFGVHVMRGISTQAYNTSTLIKSPHKTERAYSTEEFGTGRVFYTAKHIGIPSKSCAWMKNGFMSVDTSTGAGRAFLRSLYEQYAEWGVDFIKHDCIFGDDFDLEEIKFVSEVIRSLNRDILYSLSPGKNVTRAMAEQVAELTNMYRITSDDWDTWGDVASHFDVTRDLAAANMIGANGLLGNSWPDLDMLPLGQWLTDPASNQGPHRFSNLNPDEQKTQMTLWAISKSPLMFGGDVRQLDDATFNLLTNPALLEINSFSSNNMEFPYVVVETPDVSQSTSLKSAEDGGTRAWMATGRSGTKKITVYLAFFNLNTEKVKISTELSHMGKALSGRNFITSCKTKEIWSGQDFGVTTSSISMDVERHGTALFVLDCFQ